jgi:hypothetical protein
VAVGAVDAVPIASGGACGADENVGGTFPLEQFSSQGPTVDGRVKPDIAAFDGVAGNVYTTFCGTSASAPHVAGAAALVSAANPDMDAAQIQNLLEQRANAGSPLNPPNNQVGHGVLNLGDPSNITPPAGSGYTPLDSPRRILDTRTTTGEHRAPLGPGGTVDVRMPAAVPTDATAVAINLTGIATATTYLSVYPGPGWPGTSNLNVAKTTDTPAAVFATVPIGSGRTITVRNSTGSTNAVVDVLGYFAPNGPNAPGKYGKVTPQRLLDTRTTTGGHQGTLGNGKTLTLHVPASSGVPVVSSTSVIVNLTSTGQSTSGYLSVSPDCSHSSSTLNYVKGYTRANLAIVKLSSTSTFCVYGVGGPTHVVIDVVGYLAPSGVASYVPMPSPVRIVDTRTGNGGRLGGLGAGGIMPLQGAGIFDVPYQATAVLTNFVATGATTGSFLATYPGSARPKVSTLNFTAGRTVPNAAVVNLSSGKATIFNSVGSVQVVTDLFGYFI